MRYVHRGDFERSQRQVASASSRETGLLQIFPSDRITRNMVGTIKKRTRRTDIS
jgi:hypothetical protein